MAGRVEGKVVLVTGGARGNGLGIGLAMAREGASVVLSDVTRDTLERAKEQIEAVGAACHTVVADVTDEGAVQAMIGETEEVFGGLDVLVNNAGIFPFKPIQDMTRAEFEHIVAVNLVGPWLCAKYAYPALKRRGGGSIVNVTSISGHYGGARAWGAAYDASKGGLLQMTSSLAAAFGPDHIRVCAISPGDIVTEGSGGMEGAYEAGKFRAAAERTLIGRVGFPEDVGKAVVFLASEDAAFVTGTSLILDGGTLSVYG
jgi:NAD(P)-dependent dehydrogenase (short-subunit alcohol dehydrogenase family)